jgi:hypothetical protein
MNTTTFENPDIFWQLVFAPITGGLIIIALFFLFLFAFLFYIEAKARIRKWRNK